MRTNYKKGFVIPVIIAIVAVIALGGGYYYTQKSDFLKSDKKENVVTDNSKIASTTDETKDWKTYKNEEYGFEFKYPTDFSLKDEGETVPEVTTHHQWWINFRSFNGRSFIELFINENTILDINKKGASPFILGTKNGIKYNAGFEDIPATAFEISLGAHVFRIKFTSLQDSFASLEPDTFYNNEIVINQILSTFKFTDNLLDKTQPSVSSIFPSSGSIGTNIELKGYNLLSNRGDQNLMIENSSGEKASLGFGNPTHLNISENYVSIKFVVPEKVCKKVATDAALPCNSWMVIVPGEYKIYVAGPSYEIFTSNKVNFTIVDSVSVLNNKEITILGYCSWIVTNGGILLCSDDSKNINWEIDYTNAKYYEEGMDSNIQPVILSTNSLFANFDFWLKHIIQISKPGDEDFSGAPGWVKVIGFVDENNKINASKIIQHVQ